MRVYVAAKYENRDRASDIMALLRKARHTITYDWTQNEQVSADQAVADYNGVMTAEAFVLVAEEDAAFCGALVELGIALGRGIPCYVIGHALDERCIFLKLPQLRRHFERDLL
jgi:hypothetical protein